jgi:SAM-dependent methyltransferase
VSQHGNVPKPWTLDELAHAGSEHLDRDYVAAYDGKSGVDPVDDLASLHRHGFDRTSTLIDLGAGTGRFSLLAAPVCSRVVAVDVSAAMLDFLRRKINAAGVPNIECVEAGFLSYEHEGPSADAVYTRNALHHLPDFWKAVALDRIAQMLRVGGVLRLRDLIYDFRPTEADAAISRWLDGASTSPALGYTRRELIEHVRSEYTTFSLAAGADDRRCRLRHRRRRLRPVHLRPLHLRQALKPAALPGLRFQARASASGYRDFGDGCSPSRSGPIAPAVRTSSRPS